MPLFFALEQNYPNPFNMGSVIAFTLPDAVRARISVYNVRGEHVATLLEEVLPAGKHQVTWNGLDEQGAPAPSGVYLCRLECSSGLHCDLKGVVILR